MNERIKLILKYTKGPSVLDIGCAGGNCDMESPYWLHKHLHSHFPDVVGVDINEIYVKKMNENGFQVVLGNAENFRLDRRFDSIVAGEVIEHLSNPGLFLEHTKNHLKPGGRLIITTPYPFSLVNILYSFLKFPKTCSNPEHTMWFCPSTFMELAHRYGFKITHWQLVEDYYTGIKSFFYNMFVKFRWMIPSKKLRCNSMLFVLEAE